MLVYPQLSTGALCQYPIARQRRLRTIVNQTADERSVRLADPAAQVTEWTLQYAGLTDPEAAALREFFAAVEGTLESFTFLDPTGNLLAWCNQLDDAVWTRGPLLALTSGIADPNGGTKAWSVANPAGGAQTVIQSLEAPGDYTYCLSAYVRSSAPVTLTLLLDDGRAARKASSQWTRIALSGAGQAAAESVPFGIEIPAGATVEIFGMQVEAQPAASPYHASSTGGVYTGARLKNDTLAITATGVGQHACTVHIIHANHI